MKAFFLLSLCLFAVSQGHLSGRNKSHGRAKRAASPVFTVQWSTNPPAGYRVATLADFTSSLFATEYNQNNGFSYDTSNEPEGGACGLSVAEGYLKYPKSDTAHADDVTFATNTGNVSCSAGFSVGRNGLVATMSEYGCGSYEGLIFHTPVSQTFFSDNFYAVSSTCEFSTGLDSFTLYTLNSPTPTPTPTPIPTPSHSAPTSTPSSRPPNPTPSPHGSYICCGYYDFLAHFESDFCVLSGQICPVNIGGYTAVGNYTASSCKECCETERRSFINV
jgi:hypothetical protein